MRVVGLTGSAGSGKSTIAHMMLGYIRPLCYWNADSVVHRLLRDNTDLIAKVCKGFPTLLGQKVVNRSHLRTCVFSDSLLLQKLENLIHPYLWADLTLFLTDRSSCQACLLEIPLLFEVGWQKLCDGTILVKAPRLVQEKRLRKRGLTEVEINGLLSRPWPLARKEGLADYIIDTQGSIELTYVQVKIIAENLFRA